MAMGGSLAIEELQLLQHLKSTFEFVTFIAVSSVMWTTGLQSCMNDRDRVKEGGGDSGKRNGLTEE